MENAKKVLLLIPQNVIPCTDGGKAGIYFPMTFLGENFKVKAIVFIGNNEEANLQDYLNINIKAEFITIDKSDSAFNILKNVFKKLPLKFSRYFTRRSVNRVLDICIIWKPHIVICHHAHLAVYSRHIKKILPETYLILREHNIEYEIVKQFADSQKNFLKRNAIIWQFNKTKRIEKNSWEWFDRVLFISDTDINQAIDLCKRKPVNFYLLPDGINIRKTIQTEKVAAFLFTGSISSVQNEYNLKNFINHIWIPWKKSFASNFEFWITGNSIETIEKKLKISRNDQKKYKISSMGYVEDISSIMQKAKYFVSPTIIGSGLRIKILDAMSNASVVFVTPADYKMLPCFVDYENVILFNNLESFHAKFLELQQNNKLYNKISEKAYKLAKEQFSWNVNKENYIKLMTSF